MAKIDPEIRVHKDWLGLLQPVGLVVSPPALVKAQAVPSQNVAELQQQLVSVVESPPESVFGDEEPAIGELPAFFRTVLGWSDDDIAGEAGGPPIPDRLELVLPDYNETLRPTYAVVDSMGEGEPLMLVQALSPHTPFDETPDAGGRTGWSASPQAKLERLLREVKIPAGLLCNGDALRLIYAPSGESSGHLTFPVAAMCEVSGRPILAALHMLLSEHRVFSAPDGRRLLRHPVREPQVPGRGLQRPVRPGAGGLVGAATGLPGVGLRGRPPYRRPDRPGGARAHLRGPAHHAHAPHLRALRRGRGADARGARLCQQLLGLRPLRPPALRRRPLPRHHGPAVRGLRLAAVALPTHLRRRRARGACGYRSATANSSTPTSSPSSRVGLGASAG